MTEYKAEDLVKLIRAKYPEERGAYNTHVVLEQVAAGTGNMANRWVDVVVFNMWRMHGLRRMAFEIKVSRSDFLRELKQPDKYEWCMQYFHEFWYVAPKDVIKLEDLPIGVGWLYPRGKQLCTAREAVTNFTPKLDDEILASFMRSSWKAITRSNKDEYEAMLAEDPRFKTANVCQEGMYEFLRERGHYPFIEKPEDVLQALQEATIDRQLKEDRDHFLNLTGHFQEQMLSLLDLFVTIATRAIFERNEVGKYVVSSYGGEDRHSVESLKKYLRHISKDSHTRYRLQMLQVLLSGGIIDEGRE